MSSPATGTSVGHVLLVCNDAAAVRQLTDAMRQFAISTEVCDYVSMALGLLDRKKFEAVIIDFGLEQADQVLERVQLSQSNRTAVTFAITDSQKPALFTTQPNFVIQKPFSPSSLGRTLKAAFGLIVRERRRYFRCPIAIPAAIDTDGTEVTCHLDNISEGGLAVSDAPPLKPGNRVKVLFTLPGQQLRFRVDSEICWYDDQGRAGLRTLMMASELQPILQQWLAARLEENMPESVARQFRKD
jgi:hypothetical protein